jgi:hypothetical protein
VRTTVTLDPDVEALVHAAMRDRGLSFKAVVNEALRAGLSPDRPRRRRRVYSTPTYKMGFRPEVPLDKALQLAGALEDEELVRRLAVRK